jgi:hypothetical protein
MFDDPAAIKGEMRDGLRPMGQYRRIMALAKPTRTTNHSKLSNLALNLLNQNAASKKTLGIARC